MSSSPFAKVARFEYEGGLYYHKKYLGRGWSEGVKARVFGSRARRAWRGDRLLEANSFGVPESVVMGERSTDCFVVTRAVIGGISLSEYAGRLRLRSDSESQRVRRVLAEELGRVVGRMHARGIIHGDLRWGNILIAEGPQRPRFVFLDNERTRRYARTPKRKIVKNLVQLNFVPAGCVSRAERVRFWRAYRAEHPTLAGDSRLWIRRVFAVTARRWARRKAKKGLL